MTLQAICQSRVTLSICDSFDGQSNRFYWAYQNGELFGTCEARVQELRDRSM